MDACHPLLLFSYSFYLEQDACVLAGVLRKQDIPAFMCSSSFWWFWSAFVHISLFDLAFCWTQSFFQSNPVNVKCYLPSPWIPSLRFLHFSGFVLLPISQSVWELWADTSAFSWFPPVSAPSDLQFFLIPVVFTVTHQLKGTWLNLSFPSLSLSPPFCLSPRSLLPPLQQNGANQGINSM